MTRFAHLSRISGVGEWAQLILALALAVIAFTIGELRRAVTHVVGSIRRAGGGTGSAAPGDPP